MVGDDGTARADRDDRGAGDEAPGGAHEGVEHLRAAAGELIAACRAMLDVAEELLDDPAAVGAVVDGFGAFLRGAADLGRRATSAYVPGRHHDAGEARDGSGGEASRVQRIRVVE